MTTIFFFPDRREIIATTLTVSLYITSKEEACFFVEFFSLAFKINN